MPVKVRRVDLSCTETIGGRYAGMRTVGLCGTNLILSTIGASLKQQPDIQVHQIEGSLVDATGTSDTPLPDVILFDLGAALLPFVLSLLKRYPGITLIGIDLTNNSMLLLSGRQSRLLTADDLMRAIQGGVLWQGAVLIGSSPDSQT
jgi:hypothetical protein